MCRSPSWRWKIAKWFRTALPTPAGTFRRYAVRDSSVMMAGLAAKHPEIRTYVGQGVDDTSETIRLAMTPLGFTASVRGQSGIWYVDPLYHLDQSTHVVLSRTVIPANWSNTVVGAGGWIWVLGNTDNSDGAPPGTLFRIDPASGAIVNQFDPAGGESFFLSVSGEQIWFFKVDGLYALDANTGSEMFGPLDPPDRCCSGLVSDGTGGVWVISATGDGPGAKGVWHVSADGIVDQHSKGDPGELADGIGAAFDSSTTSVWIVHYEDTVSRLQITSVAEG